MAQHVQAAQVLLLKKVAFSPQGDMAVSFTFFGAHDRMTMCKAGNTTSWQTDVTDVV